jgi:hypothetical protein
VSVSHNGLEMPFWTSNPQLGLNPGGVGRDLRDDIDVGGRWVDVEGYEGESC